MTIRNLNRSDLYKRAIGRCCNPECGGDYGLEVHHVVPLLYSGNDSFVNFIVLCKDCHRTGKESHCHRDYDLMQERLFTWKFTVEILEIDHTSDDYTDNEYRAILHALLKAREQVAK